MVCLSSDGVNCVAFKPDNPNVPSLSKACTSPPFLKHTFYILLGTNLVCLSSNLVLCLAFFSTHLVCLSSGSVRCLAFKPDNPNILVSCSYDKTIKMWDLTSGSCVSTVKVDAGDLGVQCVTFNGTGDTIVAGCWNGNIFFIDTATSQVREPPLIVDSYVNSVAFSPCGKTMAVGCENGKVVIVDVATVAVMRSLTGARYGKPPLLYDCPVCGHFTAKCFNTVDVNHANLNLILTN